MGKRKRRAGYRAQTAGGGEIHLRPLPVRWSWALGGLFVVALALRLFYFFGRADIPYLQIMLGDALYFDKWAWSIARGETIVPGVFYLDPLYPYLIAFVYKIVGHQPAFVKLLQHVAGAGSCVLLAMIGQRVFNERVGLLAGAMMAGYGLIVFYEGLMLKPALGIFLLCLSLLLLLEAQNRSDLRWLFGAGAALGLSALVRGNVYVVMPILLLWVVLAFTKERRLVPAVLFVAGIAAAVFPVTIRNTVVGKDLVLSTSQGGTNFYIGNNPIASGVYRPLSFGRGSPPYEERDAVRIAEEKTGKKALKPSEVSKFWFRQGLEFIRSQPHKYLSLVFKKLVIALSASEVPDVLDFREVREYSMWLRVPLLNFAVLGPLGLMGIGLCFFTRRKDRRSWLLVLYCIGTLISVCAFFVFARYRLTMIPVFMLFAAAFLEWTTARLKARDWKPLGLAALMVLPAIFAVNNSAVRPYGPAASVANLGFAFLKEGRLDEAETMLLRVTELNPKEPMHYIGLARIYKKRNDIDSAVRQYELAEKTFRRSGTAGKRMLREAHENLAEFRLDQKELTRAEPHVAWLKVNYPERDETKSRLNRLRRLHRGSRTP